MTTFKDIAEKMLKDNKEFKQVIIQDMHDFMIEQRINKKGRYTIKLSFDSKQILNNINCIPMRPSDYKLMPKLLFLEIAFKKEKEKNSEVT